MLDIGIQLVKAIEILHETGYSHNDLKLENLMLMDAKGDEDSNNVVLIDYGYAARFADKQGNHIKKHDVDSFRGNLLFASVDQLSFHSCSRKSDLISIVYFILYMLNDLSMPLQHEPTKL